MSLIANETKYGYIKQRILQQINETTVRKKCKRNSIPNEEKSVLAERFTKNLKNKIYKNMT